MSTQGDEITSDYILVELEKAEKELEAKEAKLQSQQGDGDESSSSWSRLQRIDTEAEYLLFANDVTNWAKEFEKSQDDGSARSMSGILMDSERCEKLALILSRHQKGTDYFSTIYKEEYVPLYEYARQSLLHQFRQLLQDINYPSTQACEQLFREFDEKIPDCTCQRLRDTCYSYSKIRTAHSRLLRQVEGSLFTESMDPILLELCRPFVQSVRFHFVEQSNERPTSSKIDRLPSWLLNYIRENALEGGAWDVVVDILSPVYDMNLSLSFLNEFVRLIQWVLGQRGFFRHPMISGPHSKPELLCSAIESIMGFDKLLRDILPQGISHNQLLSLMDVFVSGDDEMLEWWLTRERESAINVLFNEDVEQALLCRISPRAELFCSLIRSILKKASLFSFSGPYVNRIAVPLCLRFLDAIQETIGSLKDLLVGRIVAPDDKLVQNFRQWIELINGIDMSSRILCEQASLAEKHGLAYWEELMRFGESLSKIHVEAIAEFSKIFVEILLCERLKLANYLMRLSHVLSCDETDIDSTEKACDVSPILKEPTRVLFLLLECCDETGDSGYQQRQEENSPYNASARMGDFVLGLLSDHLLEAALNETESSNTLHRFGCSLFARDLRKLFEGRLLPNITLRLLDVATAMEMASPALSQLGNVLCGLAGESPPLHVDAFSQDGRLFDEAMSMVRAKELVWIELSDLLYVLNHRRDLGE